MRSGWKILMAVAVVVVALPRPASADDVQEQLKQMQERLMLLEDKLDSTSEQLDAATVQVQEQKQQNLQIKPNKGAAVYL